MKEGWKFISSKNNGTNIRDGFIQDSKHQTLFLYTKR